MVALSISTLSIADSAGDMPNVRVLLRVSVQEIADMRITLLAFESEDGAGKTRLDHLVLTPDIAEGIAAALRTVLDRRHGV